MLTTSSHVTHFCKAYLSLTVFQRVFIGHLNVKALHPVWWSVHSLEQHQIFAPIFHKKVKHRDMPNIPEVKPNTASLEVLACRVQALLPLGLGAHASQTLQHTAAWEVFAKLRSQPVPEETLISVEGIRPRRHYFCCVFYLLHL